METARDGSATAKQVEANRRHAIFLRSGTGGVQVNFIDIVEILKKHYNLKRFEIAQSFNFCS